MIFRPKRVPSRSIVSGNYGRNMLFMKLQGDMKEMEKLYALANEGIIGLLKEEVEQLLEDLIAKTPVETGEAKSKWRKVDGGDRFKIVNDAAHIGALNLGSSEQAPSFFVERAALNYGRPVGTVVTYK